MSLNLEAMERIRDQKAKYCRYLDTKQFDKWEAIFKADSRIVFYNADNSVMAEFRSIAELSPMTRGLFATTRTIHQTHNSEIEFKSESQATAIWSMEDRHIYAPEGDNPSKTMHGYGFYYETWEMVGGEWKLASLELRRNIVTYGQLEAR